MSNQLEHLPQQPLQSPPQGDRKESPLPRAGPPPLQEEDQEEKTLKIPVIGKASLAGKAVISQNGAYESEELDTTLEDEEEKTLKVPVIKKMTPSEEVEISRNGAHHGEELDTILEDEEEKTLKVPVIGKVLPAGRAVVPFSSSSKSPGVPKITRMASRRETVIPRRRLRRQRENITLLLKNQVKKIHLYTFFSSNGIDLPEVGEIIPATDVGTDVIDVGEISPAASVRSVSDIIETKLPAETVEQPWMAGTVGFGTIAAEVGEIDASAVDTPIETVGRPWIPGSFGFGWKTDKVPKVDASRSDRHAGTGSRKSATVSTSSDVGAISQLDEEDSEFDKRDTIPMMVLREISSQRGEPSPAMESEISGAADGAAIVGAGSILGNFLKYGNSLLIQRGFGAATFGLYTLGMSTVTLTVSIFNLGLDDAMVRYISIYRDKKQVNLMIGLAIFCSVMAGLAGLLGAFLVFFFAPFLADLRHAPTIVPLLLLMAPLVPLSSMQAVWTGGLQGFKAFKWRVLVQRVVVPGSLTLLLIVVLIFFRDITGVVLATLLSVLVGTILNLYFFFRMVSQNRRVGHEEYQFREWLGFALPNFLASILDTVLESIDTILLAVLVASIVAIGQYAAALKITSFIAVPLQTFNVMFAPTIAELFSKGEKQKLAAMFKVVTSWTITFSLPIFLIAVLFSQPLLAISGPSFVAASSLLIALAAGNMVNAGTGSVGYMLLMTGHQRLSFLNSLTAVVVNVGLGIILTPIYGAMGTAIATGAALAVVNLMRLLQVQILLKIHPYRWDTLKPIGAGLISALLIVGLLHLLNLIPASILLIHVHLSIQLFLVPVFLVSYVVLLILFDFSPEDKLVLDKLSRKFKSSNKKKEV